MATPTQFPKLRGENQPSRAQDNISGTLTPIATNLSQTPIMGAAPSWIPFPLVAAFANYGNGYATAAYYKDALWVVRAKGVLVCAAGAAFATTIGTFPVGFRPKETQRKAVEGNGGAVQFISISPLGVCWNEVVVAAGGTLDFDFTFLAEQ